ncbi:hypothetical protein I6E84_10735 [Psychrobacter sp. SCQQ22]|uniref:hypothetical protein n=1 Tax=Psychrobacter sp. SCQQ22 TaxID=2792059 RepID=UPI0018CDC9CD|nr:hypothetical protein [Psychrobacter sp. SCQQ22]MBH0086692.1 hypothetical protein [Psychrobacter sp. SCQQ22]
MENVIKIKGKEQKELSLYIEDENLGEFISKLLGQPQSISKYFYKSFKADHNFFNHVIGMIVQRLKQQNEYEMVDFVAKISFNDGVERKITSIESFYSYSETMSLISVRVFISISLLINFPSKKIPERQDINFIFDSNLNLDDDDTMYRAVEDKVGVVVIDIEHTERTWADDMLTMIEKSLEPIWIEEKIAFRIMIKVTNFLSSKIVLLFSMLLSIFMFFYSVYSTSSKNTTEKLSVLSSRNSNIDLALINEKINLLSQISIERNNIAESNSILFAILIPFLIIIVGILKEFIKPYPSYVVLTEATKSIMENNISKTSFKNKVFSTAIMLIITLVIGILGNYFYNYLT